MRTTIFKTMRTVCAIDSTDEIKSMIVISPHPLSEGRTVKKTTAP